jgi:DNA-binding CsgD family transcriptional regulator
VRPVAAAGRFRFRHPLVRRAAYGSAAAGWRLAAHARIAAHLSSLGASAIVAAHHVERSASFGDQAAIATLVSAARSVAAQTPATAARWLAAALKLMPDSRTRLELLLELAKLQTVGGQLLAGRATAREVLRLLPRDDHERRVSAARFCAMIERLLDRPEESRALLLAELRELPDAGAPVGVPLRLRLVAENLMRVEYRAAQAILDSLPEETDGDDPAIALAIAALRPMPAYAAGRIADASRTIEIADRLMAAASDAQLAEWMDTVTWLCWAELMMGRPRNAVRRFDRALAVARATGQSYIVTSMLSGQARAYGMLGMLAEAAAAAEEAAEVARLLFSGQSLVIALAQQALVASWSGDDEAALRLSEQAVHTGGDSEEWWAAQARYARAIALIRAGRLDQGARAAVAACGDFGSPRLDQASLLSCCEEMAAVEMARGRAGEAAVWADRAAEVAHPGLEVNTGLAALARAHVLAGGDPAAAAEQARAAAGILATEQPLDAGRARLRAATAAAQIGDSAAARDDLKAAAEIFERCGARTLHAQATGDQRRLGSGRDDRPYGLSPRELEVALLVAEEYTNAQISEKLYIGVRTVETHLTHIFTKLGVTSRVAVANALATRR